MTETNNGFEANTGDWDSDFNKPDNKGSQRKKAEWMKFPKPGDYRVRLVGKFVSFLRYRDGQPFSERVITHTSYKNEDPAFKAGFYPREGFAIHIIDRADGKVKILDKGSTIFKEFANYKKVNGINPAGKDDAPDFVINVKWPGNDKFQAKYSVTATAKATPLTEAEIALVKENLVQLHEVYKSTPLQKIKELWESLPAEKRVPKPKASKSDVKNDSAPAEAAQEKAPKQEIKESMPDAPAENDDLFGDDGDGDSTSF